MPPTREGKPAGGIRAASDRLNFRVECVAVKRMRAPFGGDSDERQLGNAVAAGVKIAQNFLHSDLPSLRHEAGDDRDAAIRDAPSAKQTYYI